MGEYNELYRRLKGNPEQLQAEIAQAVRVDHHDVLTDMLRHAQTFMSFAYLQVLADTEVRKLKLHLEDDVLPAARIKAEKILAESGRKITEKAKEDEAHANPSYKMVVQRLVEAQELAAIFKRVTEALTIKRDMLQSLNSRQKVELSTLPEDQPWPRGLGLTDQPVNYNDFSEAPVQTFRREDFADISDVTDLATQYRAARRRNAKA